MQYLRCEPSQVGSHAVQRIRVEVGLTLPCSLETRGMPEPGEYGRGVSQEDVGGADSAVDHALMMEILQSVAEVPEN